MKLLLDENLSRRLVPFLLTAYPESTQVVLVGLEAAEDARVWDYAKPMTLSSLSKTQILKSSHWSKGIHLASFGSKQRGHRALPF